MGGMESPGMGAMEGMDEMKPLPPVKGFFDGDVVLFVHPEASDAKVAGMLTGMMNSPVIVVPALADVPDTSLADVFVFTNGVRPAGARGPTGVPTGRLRFRSRSRGLLAAAQAELRHVDR